MAFSEAVQAFEEGRFLDALTLFREQEPMRPNDPDLHYNIACCLFALGRRDEARVSLGRAIGLNPAYEADAREDPELAALLEEPAAPGDSAVSTEMTTTTGEPSVAPPPAEPTAGPAPAEPLKCQNCGHINRGNNWRCERCRTVLHKREPLMTKFKNPLAMSIIVTVICSGITLMFCGLPVGLMGIAAIVYATQAQNLFRDGRYDRANAAARYARSWCLITAIVSLVFASPFLLMFLFFALMVLWTFLMGL